MHYCVAATLRFGALGSPQFADEALGEHGCTGEENGHDPNATGPGTTASSPAARPGGGLAAHARGGADVQGFEMLPPGSPEAARKLVEDDQALWLPIIEQSGATAE